MNSTPHDRGKKPEMKSLENMMQECTNKIGKEKNTSKQKFNVQQSKLNWQKVSSRFPSWCCKEIVPPLYRHIEAYVTSEGRHEINNSMLLPVLLSSGLQREVLAHIWEVANHEVPGVLTPEELYATLAIVALYQSGYNVQSSEALHYFPAPPLPFLRLPCFLPSSPAAPPSPVSYSPLLSTTPPLPSSTPPFVAAAQLPLQTVVPELPALPDWTAPMTSLNQPQMNEQHADPILEPHLHDANPPAPSQLTAFQNAQASSALDDDFADFQSSVPITDQSIDDFGDFKQAELVFESSSDQHCNPNMFNTNFLLATNVSVAPVSENFSQLTSAKSAVQSNELTSLNINTFQYKEDTVDSVSSAVQSSRGSEDRYAVFRTLEEPAQATFGSLDDFGDFLSAPVVSEQNNESLSASKAQPPLLTHTDFDSGKKVTEWGNGPLEVKCSVESPVFSYEADNLDAISLSSFHHSPLRVRNLDDDISFDKISMNHLVGEALSDPTTQSISSQESANDPGPLETLETLDLEDKSVHSLPLADRYSYIRSEGEAQTLDKVLSEWTRVLDKCLEIFVQSKEIFLSGKEAAVMDELFKTEEIEDYVKNLSCVYCVVRRIYASALTSGRFAGDLQTKLARIDALWDDLSSLLYAHHKLPVKTSLDFTCLACNSSMSSCGLCLLDVSTGEDSKLTYGGREYHTSCANFWVNTVDFTLPALQNSEFV